MVSRLHIFQAFVASLIILQCFFVFLVMVNIVDFTKANNDRLSELKKRNGIDQRTRKGRNIARTSNLTTHQHPGPVTNDYKDYVFTSPQKKEPNGLDPFFGRLHLFSGKRLDKVPLFYVPLIGEPAGVRPLASTEDVDVLTYVWQRAPKTPEQRKIHEHLKDMHTSGAVYEAFEDSLEDTIGSPGAENGIEEGIKTKVEEETRKMLSSIMVMIKKRTLVCKKMVKMGGRYCNRLPDGEKYMCMDPGLAPEPFKCLVYSFGIGHDFSFDRMMGIYGCQSYAFDDDMNHATLPANPYHNVYFSRVRLSNKNIQITTVSQLVPSGQMEQYMYVYRPLDNIMYELEHSEHVLDYLKMDIEGSEWDVFSDSIFKSDILNKTRFLGLETHFLDFINSTIVENPIALQNSVRKYYRFFKELEGRGFQQLHFEPNFIKPRYAKVLGRLVPVFAEMVWVNPSAPPGRKRYNSRPVDVLIDKLEINH